MGILNNLDSYINILRPKNLLFTGFTQFLIIHLLFGKVSVPKVLNGHLMFLFILLTMLIAGAGFVINDVKDVIADKINKPQKTLIPFPISLQNAYRYYWILVGIGFGIAIYIGVMTDNIPLISIYPLASFILYKYSTKFQHSVLIGNIIVSGFVAFVSGIILVAERKLLFGVEKVPQAETIKEILVFFMFFSFFVNLVREIIKDIEDMEGDQATGGQNLSLKYGKNIATKWSIILSLFTLVALMLWMCFTSIPLDFRTIVYFVLFIVCPLSLVVLILSKTRQKRDFSRVSTILKWILLAGLGACVLLANYVHHVK